MQLSKLVKMFIILIGASIITSCSNWKNGITGIYHGAFEEIPITNIQPDGWLKIYLENQAKGLTGHLDHAAGFPFDSEGWGAADIEDNIASVWWYPYEQVGYWLDGMLRCGYLLEDTSLVNKANKQLDFLLSSADTNGYIGPEILREFRWPHTIVFRALIARYKATGDENILAVLTNHYLGDQYPYYEQHRDYTHVETILLLYKETGNNKLLKMAERIYNDYMNHPVKGDPAVSDFMDGKPSGHDGVTFHGVSYNEAGKLGAIMYAYTGNKTYLKHSVKAYEKLDQFHQLPSGIHVSAEYIRPTDVYDGFEICNITDYSWSLGYLLEATGDFSYADKIERVMLNTAPSVVTSDFKGTQYFSAPNLLMATYNSNHIMDHRPGSSRMCYAPNPEITVPCCAGNINRAMPNYVARMWMKDKKTNGIVATLFGPSIVSYQTSSGQMVEIIEETTYPFSGELSFTFKMEHQEKLPFIFRIPGWCKNYTVLLNGEEIRTTPYKNGFRFIEKKFKNNDELKLVFEQNLITKKWNNTGVSIERGPLIYSLKVEEKVEIADSLYKIDKSWTGYNKVESPYTYKDYYAYNITPNSDWAYAFKGDINNMINTIKINEKNWSGNPWSIHAAPIELNVDVVEVDGWELPEYDTLTYTRSKGKKVIHTGDFILTPQLPDKSELERYMTNKHAKVTFIPYGCTKLRMTVLPVIND